MRVDLYQLVLSVKTTEDGGITDFDLKGVRSPACKEWMEADAEFKAMIDAINAAVVKVVDEVYGEDATPVSSGEGAAAPEVAAVIDARNAATADNPPPAAEAS